MKRSFRKIQQVVKECVLPAFKKTKFNQGTQTDGFFSNHDESSYTPSWNHSLVNNPQVSTHSGTNYDSSEKKKQKYYSCNQSQNEGI